MQAGQTDFEKWFVEFSRWNTRSQHLQKLVSSFDKDEKSVQDFDIVSDSDRGGVKIEIDQLQQLGKVEKET